MNKLTIAAYPVIAALALAASLSALAAPALDVNGEGYDPVITLNSVTTRAQVQAEVTRAPASKLGTVFAAQFGKASRVLDANGEGNDPAQKLVSLRSRAEVRAEAFAARDADSVLNREGADPQYAVFQRAKTPDTAHVMAAASAKAAQ